MQTASPFAYCHVCGWTSILRCLLPRLWRDKQPFLISGCVGRFLPVVVCAHTSFSASTHVCGMGSYNRQRSARIQTTLVGEWTICFVQSRVLLGVSTPSCSMQVIVGSLFLLGVSTPSCSMQVIVGSLFLLGVSTPSCSMQVIVGSLFLLGVSTPSCSMQVIVGSLFLLGVSTPSCGMQVIVGSILHLQCEILLQFLFSKF